MSDDGKLSREEAIRLGLLEGSGQDPAAKEEFFQKLHEVEGKVAEAKASQNGREAARITLLIEEGNAAYDEWCQRRHDMGAEKYGAVKFMEVNSIEEAMAEIVDMGNYARYTFIRLYLMNIFLSENVGEQVLGPNQFISNINKFKGGK